ncbi:MAG: AAA domain-containing protein [Chlamydiales bacterium]|nr:AAA domain-containing protein [Chlamydiales bacterium]
MDEINALVEANSIELSAAKKEVHKVIVGQEALVKSLFIALLTRGHILLEGLPGLAKTLAVKSFSKVIQCNFKRIQFTPDLLPSDLIGTNIYHMETGSFEVKKGPIFSHIVLADEINRAPAKVQSALLEAMGEGQVTIADNSYVLEEPFLVLATQNPVEQEGTYPLPEAQTDRFLMKVLIDYPTKDQEFNIVKAMSSLQSAKTELSAMLSKEKIMQLRELVDKIYLDEKVVQYIIDIVFATRFPKDYKVDIEGLLEFGASPRASISLSRAAKAHAFLEGRGFVTPHDVKSVSKEVLRHRLKLSYEAQAEELSADHIIDRVLKTIMVP